ncbi:PilZ domain-containing protein [Agrobacterium tumefaciens]|nr:PilZ domain-containing protein [Agrobacterium tumefaciens]UXT20417.1 PilZ domain-containing protein [Agrobacterium tumefaciens]WHO22854.1 PilZ domain-containing protein [Agrobacterium tumefaciens]WHO24854.1 PilZ domain-containing protein [Agrobacterium tumefaciens]
MDERRVSSRLRTLKGARILYNNGSTTRDCAIRNLSSGGAKLVMETTVGLPEHFTLALEDGSQRLCQVRWRKFTELGVEFASDKTLPLKN